MTGRTMTNAELAVTMVDLLIQAHRDIAGGGETARPMIELPAPDLVALIEVMVGALLESIRGSAQAAGIELGEFLLTFRRVVAGEPFRAELSRADRSFR